MTLVIAKERLCISRQVFTKSTVEHPVRAFFSALERATLVPLAKLSFEPNNDSTRPLSVSAKSLLVEGALGRDLFGEG